MFTKNYLTFLVRLCCTCGIVGMAIGMAHTSSYMAWAVRYMAMLHLLYVLVELVGEVWQ